MYNNEFNDTLIIDGVSNKQNAENLLFGTIIKTINLPASKSLKILNNISFYELMYLNTRERESELTKQKVQNTEEILLRGLYIILMLSLFNVQRYSVIVLSGIIK